jgi:hypothetical protein
MVFIIYHPFCFPMIASWPIEWMIAEVYSLAYEFSEGSLTSSPFISVFSSRGFGPYPKRKQYILHVRLVKKKSLSSSR